MSTKSQTSKQSGSTGTTKNQGSQAPAQPDSKLTRALKIVHQKYRLVKSFDGQAYAVEKSSNNPQAYRIDSPGFGSAIRRLVHTKDPSLVLVDEQLNDIRGQLSALADLSPTMERVWYRVASVPGGTEIDVGDAANTRIIITPDNVEVTKSGSKTSFYRTPNMRPLVMPADVGDIYLLLPYLNLAEDDQWLLIAWITYTLVHPKVDTTNYVILVLQGDRGTGKSSLSTIVLQPLLDPGVVGVQAFPSKMQDFAIATQAAHVLFYDNLRVLTNAQSDGLCICVTSGYLSNRKLFSDDQESIKKLHCALVLNGIHSFIQETDLAQRSLVLKLLAIDSASRTTETQLAADFNRDLPAIFRGLLDLIAEVLIHLPTATPLRGERMQDFMLWLTAMELAMGFEVGRLQNAYSKNLVDSMADNLESNALASTVIRFARKYKSWNGTPTQLLADLKKLAGADVVSAGNWPANEISLSLRLKTLRDRLSGAGVDIELGRQGSHRSITIRYTGKNA